MMRKILTFVVPIALAACASGPEEVTPATTGAASAAKAERPDVKVGDRWVSSCTYGRKKYDYVPTVVNSVDKSRISATEGDQTLEMTPELNIVKSSEMTNLDTNRRLSFPLEVGKQWTNDYKFLWHATNTTGSEHAKVSVVGYERVRVPAGEFDAFKVKWSGQWGFNNAGGGVSSGTDEYWFWYAPAVRWFVKSHLSRHWEADWDCELTEFQLQP
jgi:hypothetical protein